MSHDGSSYYGRPVLKQPTWRSPDVPGYLFAGGLAGASAVMATMADATGRPRLRRVARLAAAGGSSIGAGLLVHDLHRPARFLNMLRVFKPTSPLSVGSWILAPFSALAAASAASELTGRLPRLGKLAGLGAAAFGPPLTTYTAALLTNTAVPAWHEAHRDMPFLFAGSATAAAGGLGLLAVPCAENGPAARLGALGAVTELAVGTAMEKRLGLVGEPYSQGRPGALMTTSKVLLGAGALGALAGRGSRAVAAASGAALLAGSLATRFGVFGAGKASAADPRYTVVPQRERVAARA